MMKGGALLWAAKASRVPPRLARRSCRPLCTDFAPDGFHGARKKVNGELAVGWRAALAVAWEVDCHYPISGGEGGNLFRPGGFVAGPAMDQHDRLGTFAGDRVVEIGRAS